MQKTEIGNGWYEVIDTRKGDDVKPFYVNKKLRKVRGYIFIFRAMSRISIVRRRTHTETMGMA
jgi:hypothetical protein